MTENHKKDKNLRGRVAESSVFYDNIQKAYLVFKGDKPIDDGACECCMEPEIKADFLNYNSKELPFHYLQDWFSAAVDPVLNKTVWIYVLPRILEALAAGEEVSYCGNEVALKRFHTGVSDNWNEAQWAVLDEFQRLYLMEMVKSRSSYIDDVLCMFGIAGWPIDDLFDQFMALSDEVLAEVLYHDWQTSHGGGDIWVTAFWGKHEEKVLKIYTSKTLYERMAAFGLNEQTDEEIAGKALFVADTIFYSSNR